MKYFKNVETVEELRKQYKELLKKYHPDNTNGSTEITQEINAEYDNLFKTLKDKHEEQERGSTASGASYNYSADKALRGILEKIVNLDGIEIEICGTWIWVSGDTYKNKTTLKDLGFKWASAKKMWYWHGEEWTRRSKKSASMDLIREKYGSTTIRSGKILLEA